MSLTVTDIAPRIVQPSTYLKKLLLNLKVHSAASWTNILRKINFEQIGVNIFFVQ